MIHRIPKGYPYFAYKTKKEWLRMSRKRWVVFRKSLRQCDVKLGCAYYPKEVYEWLKKFGEMDKAMKEYYKNA